MPNRILAWVTPCPSCIKVHFVSAATPERVPASARFNSVFAAREWVEQQTVQLDAAVEWIEAPGVSGGCRG
jgi:hypothetical protein